MAMIYVAALAIFLVGLFSGIFLAWKAGPSAHYEKRSTK
jgi:uncharacterized phage-associated protein